MNNKSADASAVIDIGDEGVVDRAVDMNNHGDASAVIDGIVAKLRAEYAPVGIVLFGSRAEGRARPDSDIDLLIIMDLPAPKHPIDRIREVQRLLLDARDGMALDVVVSTPQEFERRLAIGDHFYQDIVRRGVPVYPKSLKLRNKHMNPDNSPYVREWIVNSDRDYERARRMLDYDDAEGAGYYIQQSLEKLLKAYLIARGWRLRRTHNLVEMLAEAAIHDAALGDYHATCVDAATYYYWDRYPQQDPPPDEVAQRADIHDTFGQAAELRARLLGGLTEAQRGGGGGGQ